MYICIIQSCIDMKPATTAKLSTIAKMLAKENPEVFRMMCEKSEPMLKNISLIPLVHSKIKEEFPELDRTDESILFAATIYFAYAPATLENSQLERAPNGIRQQMCNVMQWKDLPTVNYYAGIGAAYFKVRSFKEKVNTVLNYFSGYSVKPNQTSLF